MSQGIFTGDKIIINGGTYIQNIVPPEAARDLILQEDRSVARTQASFSFDKLAGKAFSLAFHLADTDRSHSTCFPNTRMKILERIKAWALRSTEKDKSIMWLYGAAGGGKTSIARTFANWCDREQGILLGEFFFSRADGGGNHFASLAATLAYRMAVHTLKDAKDEILSVISQDPHIFQAPLAQQLMKLVLEPLDALMPNGITPHVIILDGLDETLSADEQEAVLNVMSMTVCQHNSTLKILICSRAEPTIVTAFNDDDSCLNTLSIVISLNNDVDSDTDIRTFLVERFAKIKKQLPSRPKKEWPTSANIDYLVKKSSGQFIFAATVEKYVGSPQHKHLAVTRLKHVLDLSLIQDPTKSPFADLDALYSLILSTRSDDKLSARAMAVCIQYSEYFGVISPPKLAKVLKLDIDEMWAVLYELGSLLDAGEDYIRPFHASFRDFLYEKSRSHALCCVRSGIATDIACSVLDKTFRHEVRSYYTFYCLLKDATPREDLKAVLGNMRPEEIFGRYSRYSNPDKGSYYLIPLLKQLYNHARPSPQLLIRRGPGALPVFEENLSVNKAVVEYFDSNLSKLLHHGAWTDEIFEYPTNQRFSERSTYDSSTSDDSDSDETIDGRPESVPSGVYSTSDLALLICSSHCHRVKDHLTKISPRGPEALLALLDEATFARSHLPKTMEFVKRESSRERASLICVAELNSDDISNDMRDEFITTLSDLLDYVNHLKPIPTSISGKLKLIDLQEILQWISSFS